MYVNTTKALLQPPLGLELARRRRRRAASDGAGGRFGPAAARGRCSGGAALAAGGTHYLSRTGRARPHGQLVYKQKRMRARPECDHGT